MKTNAVRLLDTLAVRYELREYQADPDALDAESVARKIGLPPEQVFKTLVVRGGRNGVCLAPDVRNRTLGPVTQMQVQSRGAFSMSRRKSARTKSTPIKPVTPVRRQPPPETGAAAGQSGDLQSLSDREGSANESVRELIEEGQFFEGSVVDGVENAPPADAGPVRVHRRPEDDLPPEYTDQPADEPKE